MRKLLIALSTVAIFLTGCSAQPEKSNEPSEQEKRNNFDACVIEWLYKNTSGTAASAEYYGQDARAFCVHFLK